MEHSTSNSRSHWPIVILSTFSSFLGLLLPLVLVRLLTPAEVGHFKIFFLYLTIIPTLSFSTGIMSGIAYWAGQYGQAARTLQTSSMLLLGLALLISVLGLLTHDSISYVFGWKDQDAVLFALALVGAIAAGFFEEAAISTGKIWTGALFYSGFELIRTASILGAVYYYRTLTSVLVAHTVIITLKVIAGYIYGLRLKVIGFQINRDEVKAVWRYAFPVSLAWVFGIFVSSADQLILSTLIPPAEFALYSIGCLSIAPLLIFEHSITRVLIPQMSEASSQNNKSRLSSLYFDGVNNLAFILIPAVTGLMIFADPIIELCFTKQYAPAAHYLRLYALSYLLLIVPYDALARANGHSSWILKTFIFFSALSVVLVYLFTQQWGPTGALLAVVFSGLILRLYSVMHFYRKTGQNIREFLPLNTLSQYTFICLLCGLVAIISKPYFPDQRIWLFVAGIGFWILYLSTAYALKRRATRLRNDNGAVLMLTQALSIGGLERTVLHLCEKLQEEKRWSIYVLAYDQAQDVETFVPHFESKGIPVEVFKKPPGFSLYVVIRILKTILSKGVRIIHSQDLGSLIYATAAKICCFGCLTIVHTQHSFIHLQRKSRYRMYEKLMTYFVDKLCVVSEETKNIYQQMGFNKDKIYVIQNGVEFSPQKIRSHTDKLLLRDELLATMSKDNASLLNQYRNEYWILYMARFFPGKGQERALKLWENLDPVIRKNAILCFVGPESQSGQYDKFYSQMKLTPDCDRIVMLGGCSDTQRWLKASDLYLSCSEYEGMPLGPLEAAGAGLPVLLSDIPGHTFLQNYAAFYPIDNPISGAFQLKKIITKLQKNDEHYLDEIWNNNRSLREQFSVDRMSRSYSIIYSESDSLPADAFSLMQASFG